jgi:hypothetical protein
MIDYFADAARVFEMLSLMPPQRFRHAADGRRRFADATSRSMIRLSSPAEGRHISRDRHCRLAAAISHFADIFSPFSVFSLFSSD